MKKDIKDISQDVVAILMNYDFPGNVRELENIMERGVALTNSEKMEIAHLPDDLKELNIRTFRKKEGKIPSLEEQETAYINWVLKEASQDGRGPDTRYRQGVALEKIKEIRPGRRRVAS